MSHPVEEMPPLTPIYLYPFHPSGERTAWGHELTRGELPGLDGVDVIEFDWRCRGCIAKAAEYVAAGQDPWLPWTRSTGVDPVLKRLSWMVARSQQYWHQTIPLP